VLLERGEKMIAHKKEFTLGLVLLMASSWCCSSSSPVFKGQNAWTLDSLYNSISKGSAITSEAEGRGQTFHRRNVEVSFAMPARPRPSRLPLFMKAAPW